jgi:hypothetical protein
MLNIMIRTLATSEGCRETNGLYCDHVIVITFQPHEWQGQLVPQGWRGNSNIYIWQALV